MAQIIQLPVSLSEYPLTVDALDPPERLLVLAIRAWVADHQAGTDPTPRLCGALSAAGASDAAFSIHQFMAITARSAKRVIAVHYPRCTHLSDDEKHMLHAASLAQGGDGQRAERALRSALLSSTGAQFAFGPLESLGELFSAAGLRFRQRRPPPDEIENGNAIEPWSSPALDQTIH